MHQQPRPVSSRFYEQKADICKAFAHPARLRVLDFLACQERTIAEIRRALNVSAPNLSQHLRLLRVAGVITCVRRKRQVYCSCSSPKVRNLSSAVRNILRNQVLRQQRWAV